EPAQQFWQNERASYGGREIGCGSDCGVCHLGPPGSIRSIKSMKAHPTAIVHPNAKLACSVTVGPYSLIGENVELGEDCEVMSHCVLEGHTRMGKGNRIFPYASIGLIPQDLKYRGEATQVEIGDGNAIRECVTIHRGTEAGDRTTRIGSHNLLMAYVHIAHNCHLGSH